MNSNLAGIAAIVVLTYFLGEVLKLTKLNRKWIPTILGCFGAIAGVLAFLFKIPDFLTGDLTTSCVVGFISSLAATGIHQMIHQR